MTGTYRHPVRLGGRTGALSASLTFSAYSGRPIEVLGYHPAYAEFEVFILPRGSGGRLPAVTQFDLRLAYEQTLRGSLRVSLAVDVVNLFNQRQVVSVDDEYTGSTVGVLLNGRPEDLHRLRTLDGGPVVANSNYGQPNGWQAPLYLRIGGRLSF